MICSQPRIKSSNKDSAVAQTLKLFDIETQKASENSNLGKGAT